MDRNCLFSVGIQIIHFKNVCKIIFLPLLDIYSHFPVELLQELSRNVMNLQPSDIHGDDLAYQLILLERAAQEDQISPEVGD